jgi:hypothetical protein
MNCSQSNSSFQSLLQLLVALLLTLAAGCSDEILCGEGTQQVNDLCLSTAPDIICGEGTEQQGDECTAPDDLVECGENTHLDGDLCVPDYEEVTCSDGTHLESESCVPDYEEITCADGTHLEDGVCIPDYDNICGEGTEEVAGVCIPDIPSLICGPGTVELEGECILSEPITRCGPDTIWVDGECLSLTPQWSQLPFPQDTPVTLGQCFNGGFSHNERSVYAVDIPADTGEIFTAARGGVVVRTREDSDTGCGSIDCADNANYIYIDHGDGTLGKYLHLVQNGVLVEEGQSICAGEPIGMIGSTGWSTGPHLHFEIIDYMGYSLPLRFEELREHSEGIPFSGVTTTSDNSEIIDCLHFPPTECPATSFTHMGVMLERAPSCTRVEADTPYEVSGTVLSDYAVTPYVMLATYSYLTESWDWNCQPTEEDGTFSHTISWPGSDHTDLSHLMISAAYSDCFSLQSWYSSPYISVAENTD